MTKNEANKKWCPMARVVELSEDSLHGPFNRYHSAVNDDSQARCLADGCAMWVWDYRHNGDAISPAVPEDRWQGRCGLVER